MAEKRAICGNALGSAVARNLASLLVAPDSGKPRMAQAFVRRPFQKLDSSNQESIEPSGTCPFSQRVNRSPKALGPFKQIDKAASRYPQLFEMR
jgi:hypothetical protein